MYPRSRSCFTLLEILLVIAIIAILAGSTVGLFSYVSRKSRDARTLATVEMIRSGLEQYKTKYGFYLPATQVGYIQFHLDRVTSHGVSDNFNQFINYNHLSLPENSDFRNNLYHVKDGYGRPIYYRCPGYVNKTSYDLGSLGADGRIGAETNTAVDVAAAGNDFGKGDDITNCRR